MICSCGTTARWIVNGTSDSLKYWFCDTCKDEASVGPATAQAITTDYPEVEYVTFRNVMGTQCVDVGMSNGSSFSLSDTVGSFQIHTYPFFVVDARGGLTCKTYNFEIDFIHKTILYTHNFKLRGHADGYKRK